MSEYYLDRDGYWKIRLLRSPGVFLNARPTKGLHTVRGEDLRVELVVE